jgi:hypothetical protein
VDDALVRARLSFSLRCRQTLETSGVGRFDVTTQSFQFIPLAISRGLQPATSEKARKGFEKTGELKCGH